MENPSRSQRFSLSLGSKWDDMDPVRESASSKKKAGSSDQGASTVVGMDDGKPEAVEVFLSTGGAICLLQSDENGEDLVVALRPEDVPEAIERLQACLAKYEEMIQEDPRAFEGEEQLTLSVGAT